MEVMQTVTKMQNSQMSATEKTAAMRAQEMRKIQEDSAHNEKFSDQKLNSKEELKKLVEDLNKTIEPLKTTLKFGFDDTIEELFVSVIDKDTNRVLRRYPAEQAARLMPKIEELSGLLVDEKG